MGVYGSYIGLTLNVLVIIATFYVCLPAAPIAILLYLLWKMYTRNWYGFLRVEGMDIDSGIKQDVIGAGRAGALKSEKSNDRLVKRRVRRVRTSKKKFLIKYPWEQSPSAE